MSHALKIIVADDEPRMREFYKEVLPLLGHQVIFAAGTGAELIAACLKDRPDLVITDIKMPDMDGIEAAEAICRPCPIPVILVSAYDSPDLLDRAGAHYVLAYLVKPIKKQDLQPAIMVAVRRFEELQTLQKETTDLRQALQDRKLIERAKGILMKRAALDEPAAFQRLQRLARDSNRKLVQVAEMVLAVEGAFQPPPMGPADPQDG